MASQGDMTIDALSIKISTSAGKSTSNIDKLTASLSNLQSILTKDTNKLNKLNTALQNLQNTSQKLKTINIKTNVQQTTSGVKAPKSVAPKTTETSQATTSTDTTQLALMAPKSAEQSSTALERIAKSSEDAGKGVDDLRNKTTQAEAAFNKATPTIDKFSSNIKKADGTNFSNINEQIAYVVKNLAAAKQASGAFQNSISNTSTVGGVKSTVTATQKGDEAPVISVKTQGVDEAGNKISLLRKTLEGLRSVGAGVGSAVSASMRGIGRAGEFAGNTIKKAGSVMSNAFNTMKAGASKLAAGANKSFKSTVKSLGQLALALTGVRGLFTALRKAVSAYMSYDSSLSDQLQNDWAVLGSLLAPVLERIIDLFTRAVAYINAFVKALTGVDLVAKANAKSAAKAAAGTKKYADELGNLQKFDDLNVVNFDKDKDSGSGGGGNKPLSVAGVDTSWMDEFIDKIKVNDWYGLGMEIGRKFNEGLRSIDFDWLITEAKQWGKNFGDLTNGLMDGVDWNLLGETVSNGFATVFGFVNTYFSTVNWQNLGSDIGEGLKSAFNTMDWGGLGQFLTNKIMAITDVIYGLVSTDGMFSSLGSGLSDALESAFANIDVGKMIASAGLLFMGLLEGIQAFISETDWASLMKELSSEIISGLGEVTKAIQEFDWWQLGDDLYNAFVDIIANTDWAGIAASLAEFLGSALGGITTFLISSIGQLCYNIIEAIKNYFLGFITDENGDGQFGAGEIISGLLNGLLEGVKSIGTWIYDNIFSPFIEGFKKAFGIHSPSKVMIEMGGYIIDGLKDGVKGIWDKVKDIFVNLVTNIKTKFTEAMTNIKTIFSVSNIKTVFTNVVTTIKNVFNTVTAPVKKVFSDLWTGIKNIFSSVGTWFSDHVTSPIKNSFTGLKDGLTGILNKIIEAFNKMIRGINKLSFDVPDWVPVIGGKKWGFDLKEIPQLATGTNKIEVEGLYHLHQGEAVVPKRYNPAVNNQVYSETNRDILIALNNINNSINNQEQTTIVNVEGEQKANRTYKKQRRQTNIYGKTLTV